MLKAAVKVTDEKTAHKDATQEKDDQNPSIEDNLPMSQNTRI